MRTVLGVSLSVALGLVAISLLPAAVAVGQSEEPIDPMRPRAATIEFDRHPVWVDGTRRADDPGVLHFEGDQTEFPLESSDPRLSGTVTHTGNRDIYQGAAVMVESIMLEVANEGGRWIGPMTRGKVGSDWRGTALLRGEGDYEGLTALVFLDFGAEGSGIAAIFPGEMPPVPLPAE
jgi:hypothetical protein